ncbi:MAG: helix-turn-helix transcriptional regulator [Myxococcales bacterium]|nr:helix-turn-helix transcriptional regulator [Myxococcales bacterium]
MTFPGVKPDELRARAAQRIREIAEQRGVSLTTLVREAKVSQSHLWAVLGGRRAPTTDFLAKLANVLRVEPMEFLRPPRKPRAPK